MDEYEKAFLEDEAAAEQPVSEDAPKQEAQEPEAAPEAAAEPQAEAAPASEEQGAQEPQASAEKAPEQGEGEIADYREAYEKLLHRVKTEDGRLPHVVDENRQLRARLREMEAEAAEQAANIRHVNFTPDEVEAEDIAAFRKNYPEVAKATVDGKKASAWQKLLVDRGPEEVVALYETRVEDNAGAVEELRAELQRRDHEKHLADIEAKHPDWVDLVVNKAPQHSNDTYNPEFVGWVETLPYKAAQGVVWAIQNGTAAQINEVLDHYKAHRNARSAPAGAPQKSPAAQPTQARKVAPGALAVPQRGAPHPPKGQLDPNDYEGAWASSG